MTPSESEARDDVIGMPAAPVEDQQLVERLLRRDRKAAAEFVERYAGLISGYLRSRLWPRQDLVDDLAQDVFMAAWERLEGFRAESSLKNWLLGIARHKVEDHYRAVLRAANQEPDSEVTADAESLHFEQSVDRERIERKMRSVLEDLPESYRAALLWRYWENRSLREMASSTGRTEKAMERLLARARKQFRERWNDV